MGMRIIDLLASRFQNQITKWFAFKPDTHNFTTYVMHQEWNQEGQYALPLVLLIQRIFYKTSKEPVH